MSNIAIVWFRNDLRLHDNEAILEAKQKAQFVVPIYVFDERLFYGKTSYGFEKISKFRTRFIIEAVTDLRTNLRKIGSDLFIKIGKPEEIVYELANTLKSSWVYCNRERTDEEVKVQDRLEKNLWKIGMELRFVRGKMLYHTADLPFPVSQVPDVFTNYRKEVENITPLRPPLEAPTSLPFPDISVDRGEVPKLADFNKEDTFNNHVENQRFKGGESHALKQLEHYLFETKHISSYKQTRNDMFGWDFSSKLSPWLAAGCLSPKKIVDVLAKYEQSFCKNESTYQLYFELMWRDYFRLIGKKYGNNLFKISGLKNIKMDLSDNMELFLQWKTGNTGIPLIDANMIQLNETGFMSNRGRQNVASFLVKDLKVNWLLGAEYFESLLIDYDPCSNYGNWNYIAGIGNDPREDRYFNILSQSKKYDPEGIFIKYWIPALKDVPVQYIHQPETLPDAVQLSTGFKICKDYPYPILAISN